MLYPESLAILKESLDTQSARIAVVDSEATIVLVNSAWCAYGEKNGGVPPYGVGSNYLTVLESQSSACPPDSEDSYVLATIHQGLHDILAGKQDTFEREYTCLPPGQPPNKAERYRVLIRPVQLFDFFGAQLRHERVLDPHNETVRR